MHVFRAVYGCGDAVAAAAAAFFAAAAFSWSYCRRARSHAQPFRVSLFLLGGLGQPVWAGEEQVCLSSLCLLRASLLLCLCLHEGVHMRPSRRAVHPGPCAAALTTMYDRLAQGWCGLCGY